MVKVSNNRLACVPEACELLIPCPDVLWLLLDHDCVRIVERHKMIKHSPFCCGLCQISFHFQSYCGMT